MENFDLDYLRFANGVQQSVNSNQNVLEPQNQSMDITPEAGEYQFEMQNFERPLQNEMDILRYCKILGGQSKHNDILFNAEDEAKKIKSGYYINIDESLNIFKEFHDVTLNPFFKLHKEATEYLKFAQKSDESARQNVSHVCSETFDDNDSDNSDRLLIDETNESDEFPLFSISDDNCGENEPEKSPENCSEEKSVVTKQPNVKNVVNNRKSRCGKVHFSAVNSVNEEEISHKKIPKMSTPNKNTENIFQSLPLSPISHPAFPYFTSKEIQLLKSQSPDEKEYLRFLEEQFCGSIFEENGQTLYPISTNCDFEGFTYDLSQELKNNEIINNEIFCRFWRKNIK